MSEGQWRSGKYFPDKTGRDWDRTELRHKVDDDVYSQILRVAGDVSRTVEDDVADITAQDAQSFDYDRDLRDLRTYTIDPVNAKDYDDAISIEQDGDRYRAYVHIANVAQQIDGYDQVRETALEQGRTFYFEHGADHMLPADLSDQFSLLEDEDRLAFTVEFEFAPVSTASGGQRLLPVETPDIYQSLVNVDANLSYTDVATRDTGITTVSRQPEIDERLENIPSLSEYGQRWKSDRRKAEETYFSVDSGTALYDSILQHDAQAVDDINQLLHIARNMADERMEALEYGRGPGYLIVEEFMVRANKACAEQLEDHPFGVFRVHGDAQDGWREQVDAYLAETTPMEPGRFADAHDWMLEIERIGEAYGAENLPPIAYSDADSENRAYYLPFGRGHEALGFDTYAPFTSPVRRAPDIVNQEILADISDLDHTELNDWIDHWNHHGSAICLPDEEAELNALTEDPISL